MTIRQGLRSERGMSLSSGGWGGWLSDPAAVPPPSVYNQAISGVIVNERSILSLMVVASCIRVIGDSAGGLFPHVHRQQGNKRRFDDPEVDPPDIVVDPCADIDREWADFNLIASWCLNGNAFFHIIDRQRGYPSCVEIYNPSQVRINSVKGMRVVRMGSDIGPVIPNSDIVHRPWMSLASGLIGLNPVEHGAVGFGIPIAMNEYASRYFAQGIHPTGVFTTEKPIQQKDKDRLVGEIMSQHGGLAQSHTPIILDSNAKWQQISINPETAQLLGAREFSRGEIAGFYGVPPHLVGDTTDSETYGKGLQEMVMGFALFGLSGYTRRLDRMYTALLPTGYYVRRKVSELFKTNDQALGTFINMLRMSSTASPNEARELIGMAPSHEEGADSLFAPINSAHSDFMLTGGGALTADAADADQGTSQAQPRPAGNTGQSVAPPPPRGKTGANPTRGYRPLLNRRFK